VIATATLLALGGVVSFAGIRNARPADAAAADAKGVE